MDLFCAFLFFIKNENLFQTKDKLLLAVSGGVDSVVLCDLCNRASHDFSIAHCNFQLRAAESERDEEFVKSLSEKYGVEIFVKKFDTENFAEANKLSIQVAARELRYQWFNEIINDESSSSTYKIVTAHHANDNVETLLMNFFRGTGIAGLRGILPKQDKVIRPLLFATKEQLKSYAKENGLAFVEDSSNASDKYTRNFFRNQLIPSIEKVFPKAAENLQDNIQRFREIEMLYQQSVSLHKKKLLEPKGNEMHIPVLKLLREKPLFTIVFEIIKEYNFTAHQVPEVMHLITAETGKYVQSSSHKIFKNRNWLIITPGSTLAAQNILIEENDTSILFSNGKIKIEKAQVGDAKISADNSIAMLDAKEINFPLLLRKWGRGDYFYPLGMSKKKKLGRFFTDQKLSLTDKENTWVMETNKKIVWVVGKRIDDRFKITPATKSVIKFILC